MFPEVDRRVDSGCNRLIAAHIRVVSLAASPRHIPKASKDKKIPTTENLCFQQTDSRKTRTTYKPTPERRVGPRSDPLTPTWSY